MSDKNARSILLSNDALRSGDIFFKGRLRLLDNADVVAILEKNVVNALPARTLCPGAMYEYDVFYGRCQSQCSGQAEDEKGGDKVDGKVSVDHIWFSLVGHWR